MERKIYNKKGKLEKMIISNDSVSEILYFYSSGEIFYRQLVDIKNGEEYVEYLSKKGDIITKLKNNYTWNYKLIYDMNSGKYLKLKEKKLYYNGRIYFGKVKYYNGIFLIEEAYTRTGKLKGTSKITHYEDGVISETERKLVDFLF